MYYKKTNKKLIACTMVMAMWISLFAGVHSTTVQAAKKAIVKKLIVSGKVALRQNATKKVNVRVKASYILSPAKLRVSVKTSDKDIVTARISKKPAKKGTIGKSVISLQGISEGTAVITVRTKAKDSHAKPLVKKITVDVTEMEEVDSTPSIAASASSAPKSSVVALPHTPTATVAPATTNNNSMPTADADFLKASTTPMVSEGVIIPNGSKASEAPTDIRSPETLASQEPNNASDVVKISSASKEPQSPEESASQEPDNGSDIVKVSSAPKKSQLPETPASQEPIDDPGEADFDSTESPVEEPDKAKSNIQSIQVDPLDKSCLMVTMKKPASINISDIKLFTKGYNNGNYNSKVSVKAITSTDQATYRLYTNAYIGAGRYIRLVIGNDVFETQNKPDFLIDTSIEADKFTILLKKDAVGKIYCGDYFVNGIGSLKFVVKEGALPAGMELSAHKGLIKGVPTTVGDSSATIEATDELGRKASVALRFKVYDDATIVAAPTIHEVRLDDYVEARIHDTATNKLGETFYQGFEVAPKGGSGQYYFSLTETDTSGTALSTDLTEAEKKAGVTQEPSNKTSLRIPFSITEGTHTFTIHITDADDSTIEADTTVTLNAVQYFGVKGVAKDVSGSNLSGNKLYFIPKDAVDFNQYIEGMSFDKMSDFRSSAASARVAAYDDEDDDYSYGADGYRISHYNYTARVGTSNTDTTIGKQKGTYATELKSGEYIVMIYSDVDGVYYQMDQTVTVGTADMMQSIIMPVRFFSVAGTAAYANGNPISNRNIFFETQEDRFEDNYKIGVRTDGEGHFIVFLPANIYSAYVVNANNDSDRCYFMTNIEVKDADVTLSSFALAVSRNKVSGVARVDGALVSRYSDIYFFKNDKTTNMDYAESAEVGMDGAYSIDLPDGTYYVKFREEGAWRSFGTVTVAGQDIEMDLSCTIQNEMGDSSAVPEIQTETALTVSDKGSFAKITIPEDATGNYTLEISTITPGLYYLSGKMYDSSYHKYSISSYDSSNDCNFYFYSDSWENGVATYSRTLNFKEAGTYYIKLVPNDNYFKTIRSATLNLSITKSSSSSY